jgi:hypothetical protein
MPQMWLGLLRGAVAQAGQSCNHPVATFHFLHTHKRPDQNPLIISNLSQYLRVIFSLEFEKRKEC